MRTKRKTKSKATVKELEEWFLKILNLPVPNPAEGITIRSNVKDAINLNLLMPSKEIEH